MANGHTVKTHRRPLMRKVVRGIIIPDFRTKRELEAFRRGEITIEDSIGRKPATEVDIEIRKAYELNRFLKLRGEGGLTPQWIAYGERHKREIKEFLRSKGDGKERR